MKKIEDLSTREARLVGVAITAASGLILCLAKVAKDEILKSLNHRNK